MLCEKCKKDVATVSITTIINGDKTVKNLCAQCAEAEGHLGNGFHFNEDWPNLLPNLFSLGGIGGIKPMETLTCPQCQLSFREFTKGGRLGCSHCYEAFRRQLAPILKQIHAGDQHEGKVPKRLWGKKGIQREIEGLKIKLQQAVEIENFEEAAKLRDDIKALQKKAEKGEA